MCTGGFIDAFDEIVGSQVLSDAAWSRALLRPGEMALLAIIVPLDQADFG